MTTDASRNAADAASFAYLNEYFLENKIKDDRKIMANTKWHFRVCKRRRVNTKRRQQQKTQNYNRFFHASLCVTAWVRVQVLPQC